MKKLQLILLLFLPNLLFAQSAFLPLGNQQYYQFMDRMEIKSGHMLTDIHTSTKPFLRQHIIKSMHNFDTIEPPMKFTRLDWKNLEYIDYDNTEWINSDTVLSVGPILNYFYRTKSDLYSVQTKDFMLKINPVLSFGISNADGKQDTIKESMFVNTRGVELRSWIAQKVGIYLYIAENQTRYPNYVQQKTIYPFESVPGEGYYKEFHKTGVDYFATRGYINFTAAKFITVTFGNDKNFLGNGYRSLQLSDFSQDYLFLKLNTQVWRINYTNIFANINAVFQRGGDQLLPKKFAAFHHLSVNATKFLNVGLFEAVIFNRSIFEPYYMNPIIFYRSIEQRLGSPDNSLIGIDAKVNFLRHVSAYGQFTLDDLNVTELKAHKGYWGNKYGIQIGAKYVDAFTIPNLDLQIENNMVVPYTYTHSDSASYTNYNQPLAHPLGASFNEIIGIVRYQPIPNLWLTGKIFSTVFSQDSTASNFGSNIRRIGTANTVFMPYGNKIGQGVRSELMMFEFTATYMVRHNLFVDVQYLSRTVDAFTSKYTADLTYLSVGIRLNIARKDYEF